MERKDSAGADQEDSLAAMDSPVTSMDSLAAMDSPRLIARLVRIPAHSAALTTEEPHEASPTADTRVSVEAFMLAEASTAEAVTGNLLSTRQLKLKLKIWRKKLCKRTK